MAVGWKVGDELIEKLGTAGAFGDLVYVVKQQTDLGRGEGSDRIDDGRYGRCSIEGLGDALEQVARVRIAGFASDPDVASTGSECILLDGLRQRGGLAEAGTGADHHDPRFESREKPPKQSGTKEDAAEIRRLRAKWPTHAGVQEGLVPVRLIHLGATVPLTVLMVQMKCHQAVTREIPSGVSIKRKLMSIASLRGKTVRLSRTVVGFGKRPRSAVVTSVSSLVSQPLENGSKHGIG